MRGVYTVGVLAALMDHHFLPDELIGVSAGASNSVSYLSGQSGRGYRTNIDYIGDKRYLSLRNYVTTKSLFGMDFIFDEVPNQLDPFDYDALQACPCSLQVGVTDVETGKAVFFGKEHLKEDLTILKASCSLPIFSPMVAYQGRKYLDGGVADPIPIDKALADGCDRILVVLTQDRAYRKKPQAGRAFYHMVYRRYPQIVQALDRRHLVYNRTLKQLRLLERSGKAIVVAPKQPLGLGRFEQDKQRLIDTYQLAYQDGKALMQKLNG